MVFFGALSLHAAYLEPRFGLGQSSVVLFVVVPVILVGLLFERVELDG